MKKVYVATVILYLCVGIICFFRSATIYGAETLKITQDHFEFRDEPRVAEETLLGTLRAGTPVEWTGNTDGNWFEVRAPNGQVGWVHSSGISKPKSPSRPKATPTPKQTTSRGTSRATTSSTTLQKTVTDLEKANTQYKALLEEKDRRVGELTREIEELEQKLVETAQEIDDTKQFQEMGQAELTDLQNEYDTLKAALAQKDAELGTLQQDLNALQEKVRPTERILYGLNAFWLLLLSGIGIFLYIRHKKQGNVAIETEFGYEHRNYVTDKQQISPELTPHPPIPATPAGTPPVSAPVMGAVEEDVVIELSDVLPIPEQPIHEEQDVIEEIQDVEIITDIEEIEEIQEVEEIEELSEADVIEPVEEIEEIEEIEEVEEIVEIEEPEIIDDVEEVEEIEEIVEPTGEEPEFIEEAEEITDVEELIEELGEADSGDVELELIPDDLIEEVPEELPTPAADAISLHEELEELEESLEAGSDFYEYDAFYDELTGDASQEEIPAQEASEIVEVVPGS